MTLQANISVMVWALRVKEKHFRFRYWIYFGTERTHDDVYESTHIRSDIETFRKELKSGYAIQLAIEQIKEVKL